MDEGFISNLIYAGKLSRGKMNGIKIRKGFNLNEKVHHWLYLSWKIDTGNILVMALQS